MVPSLQNLHGVFMVIDPWREGTTAQPSHGVLIRGEPGIGKSHTALALIDRGHALVADDAPLFTQQDNGQIMGRCPELIQDLIEVRGLGLMNLRHLFGERALYPVHSLDMMIELIDPSAPLPTCLDLASEQRLHGDWHQDNTLGSPIPSLTLRAQAAPMLALLIETAARTLGHR